MRVFQKSWTALFCLSLLGSSAVLAAGQTGQIESRFPVSKAGHSCAKDHVFRDFLAHLPQWHSVVKTLTIVAPEDVSEKCLGELSSSLKAQNFQVVVSRKAYLRDIRVTGQLEGAKEDGTVAKNTSSEKMADGENVKGSGSSATQTKDDAQKVAANSDRQKDKLAKSAANSDRQKDKLAKSAANSDTISITKTTAGPNKDNTTLSEVQKPVTTQAPAQGAESLAVSEEKPAASELGTAASVEQETPIGAVPFHPPPSLDIARWKLGWSFGYLAANGTGISSGASGINFGLFSGSYLYSSLYEFRGDILTPFVSSKSLPNPFILHAEVGKYFKGARQTFKKTEQSPQNSLQGVLGVLSFMQSSSDTQASGSFTQAPNLLTELATVYVGVKGGRRFSNILSGTAELHLIPVIPLGVGFSIGEEILFSMERAIDFYSISVSAGWANYTVKDPTLGDLTASYSKLQLGVIFPF